MKILHFSDSHAGAPAEDYSAFFDKRWVGIFNYYFRRRFQHNQGVLKRAVEFMLRSDADLFVCTGDITSTGQTTEFKRAVDILSALSETKKLIYIPGNHDFYVYHERCNSAMRDAVRMLNYNALSLSDLPLRIQFSDCDIIIVNESWPSNLISSCGFVMKKDSDKILEILKNKDKPIILVGHYPLIEDRPLMRIRHRLWGQEALKKMLLDGVIDLSLCGHIHKAYHVNTRTNGRGEYCAGSVTRNAMLSEILYDRKNDIFQQRNIEI